MLHILNVSLDENEPKGTITSNDIMDGKVEGTYHKELKDFNDKFAKDHPDVQIDKNPIGYAFDDGVDTDSEDKDDEVIDLIPNEFSGVMTEDDASESEIKALNQETKNKKKKKGLFGKKGK
jgi:hypothetical protein